VESGAVKGYSKRLWKKAFVEKREHDCIWFKGGALMEMFWLCDFFGGYE